MSLSDFQAEMERVDAVSNTEVLEENGEAVLKVSWSENPANYSVLRHQIRQAYPNIAQVEAPAGEPKKDSDAMPITYYSEE